MHILIVDDDVRITNVLGRLLRKDAHNIATYNNPYLLLKKIRRDSEARQRLPDLVISDGSMHCQMTGTELHRALVEEGLLGKTRFILYTGEPNVYREYCEANAVPCFAKPNAVPLLDYIKTLTPKP